MNTDIIENLKKRGFIPFFVKNCDEVLSILKENIPAGAVIGFGGSITVETLDIPKRLKQAGYICNHNSVSDMPYDAICQNNRFVDYYITGTNAITEDGQLVNTDGRANRISAMCYGPKKLFLILGKNKICKDLKEAIERIENVAAPLNAKRLKKNTPCAVSGKCSHCEGKDTICKATLILHHPTSSMEVFVIIVDSELGF
jgi:hypothetical protein